MSGILLTIAIGIMSIVFGIALNAVIKETIREKRGKVKVIDRKVMDRVMDRGVIK